jgi:hypothetical protein
MAQVLDWCSAPGALMVAPTARHGDVLSELLSHVGAGGNLVNDAHLARWRLSTVHESSATTVISDGSMTYGGKHPSHC